MIGFMHTIDGAVADPETDLLTSGPKPDIRPRKIPSGKKCGGSPFGTTADTCQDKLYCNYQTPTFAKCVKATKSVNFDSDPPHECGGVGAQCMGDKDFLESLGAERTGRCCEEGLSCVFQAPYVGLCADPNHYIYADAFPEQPAPVEQPAATPVDTPVEEPEDSPVETPVDAVVEKTVEEPVQTPSENPVAEPVESETPVDDPKSLPGERQISLL